MQRPFLLAQISDLHIRAHGAVSFGIVDTGAMLGACIEDLLSLKQPPDAVAITGDLTDSGAPDEYAALRELLAPLQMPIYLVPGNHDERRALRDAFPDHAYLRQSSEFVQYAIDEHPLRIVAIDTVVPGAPEGELCEKRLAWLERTLAEAPQRTTVVLMHHPPFRTFIEYMDSMGLREPAQFESVIRRHPQVEAILCGHIHRPIDARFAGTRASIAPSTAHQIALDLARDARPAYVMEPPAYRLHAYSPESGFVSHTAYVGKYPGPYSFTG